MVAINVDTIYAEDIVDLRAGPQVLTVPSTTDHYSLLTLDVFGHVLKTNVTSPGAYALVPRGFKGTLPSGLTKVTVPCRFTLWIFRADRYAADGTNMVKQAKAFKRALRATSLAKWESDHTAGRPRIIPVALYGPQMKAIADKAIANQPTEYLRKLQAALHSPTTQPLSASDRRLSRSFDRVFRKANKAARHGRYQMLSQIIAGTREAHAMIINRWQTHIGKTLGCTSATSANGGTPTSTGRRYGSITIYIQHTRPRFARKANWLPVPNGPDSLLFRIYGPEGNTAPGASYVPPEIRPFGLPARDTTALRAGRF